MRDCGGPAVLRLWCVNGHQIGSLIDVAVRGSVATFVPHGAEPQQWPPTHRVTGKRATWFQYWCPKCSAEVGDSVDSMLSALQAVRSDPGKTTGDVQLAPETSQGARPLAQIGPGRARRFFA
jgi:hypothetical protein